MIQVTVKYAAYKSSKLYIDMPLKAFSIGKRKKEKILYSYSNIGYLKNSHKQTLHNFLSAAAAAASSSSSK